MKSIRDLEVRHLIALEAVARLGTFGRAADELGYTQSAVSQQIAAFERLLGGRLFDRPGGPRPVTLTPLGERMLAHAQELLSAVEAVGNDIDEFVNGATGGLRVATFESTATSLLPDIIGQLLAERPKLEITIHETDDGDRLLEWLRTGQADISFAVGVNGQPGEFEMAHLLDDPYYLVTRADDPTYGAAPNGAGRSRRDTTGTRGQHGRNGSARSAGSVVATTDLNGVPLIGDQNSDCMHRVEASLRKAGVEPRFVFRSSDNTTILAMVRAGLGLAVMPGLAIDHDDSRLAVHTLDPPIPDREICLTWRANRTLPPGAERFVELAREVAERHAERYAARRAVTA